MGNILMTTLSSQHNLMNGELLVLVFLSTRIKILQLSSYSMAFRMVTSNVSVAVTSVYGV